MTLVEGRDDVGDGTSKANTALLHTGFDATPGTLESRLVARGYHLLGDYAEADRHPRRAHRRAAGRVDRRGTSTPCPACRRRPSATATTRCEIVDADEVYRRVPDLGPGALAGLTVPGESIICTWTTNLALATDAVATRGASCCAARAVTGVVAGDEHTTLRHHARRRPRPLGRSTRRASAPTTSTPSSATTASPSPRGAVNCWCSTS